MKRIDEAGLLMRKSRAARLSLITNVSLALLKLAATVFTGSISLLSEVVHSASDVLASVLAVASIKVAATPPDDEHPYGHGKVESLAGLIESILLFGIVGYILAEAIPRLFHPTPLHSAAWGILAMAINCVACFFVGRHVLQVGLQTDSGSLQANGAHIRIDAVSSLGVMAALIASRYAHFPIADPLVACAIAIWIAGTAVSIFRNAFNQLIDQRVTDEELSLIHGILDRDPEVLSYHRLLTRHSGSYHYVQVHVVVPRHYSVVEGHTVADRLEKGIAGALSPAYVVIHVDPLEPSKLTGSN